MNVLHVVPHLGLDMGGAVTTALGMADALGRAGLNVRLSSTDHGSPQPDASLACETRLFRCRFCPWRYAPALGRWLSSEVGWADVVHIHTLWLYPTRAAARASWRAEVPYVLTPQGMLEERWMRQHAFKKRAYAAAVEFRTVRRAGAIHWASDTERERSRRWSGAQPGFVAPLGLSPIADDALPDPRRFRLRFPEVGEERLLLFLGRLHPQKQPEVAIRALAAMRGAHADAALVLAGSGDARYVDSLRTLARDLGLARSVHFTGLLTGTEVHEALRASAALVLPSLQESFGLAVAEAMAVGCPVVVTPEVALAPLVSEHRCGAVAPATPEAFAAAAIALLADEDARREAGRRARSLALEEFGWPSVARRMIAAYENLLGRAEPDRATA